MEINNRYIIGSWEINEKSNLNSSFLGGKAIGLFNIPNQWTLPFVILTKNFYESWNVRKNIEGIFENIAVIDTKSFDYFLGTLLNPKSQIFIRSNSPNEDISSRGTYNSIVVKNELNSIKEGVNNILTSAFPEPMYIILQECISPGLTGHMSNERRVTADVNRWLVEQQDVSAQDYIFAKKESGEEELFARNEKGLFTSLRRVAGLLISLNNQNTRYHCEWIWNGYRVWMVQIDKSISTEKKDSATLLIEKREKAVPKDSCLKILVNFTETNSENWKKLRSPIEFRKIKIPYSDVFLLRGDQWNDEDVTKQKDIADDIRLMCLSHPIIIRCDIANSVEMEDLLLPTSGTIISETDALAFMSKVSLSFDSKGLSRYDWTFLISFQYSVKVSALVHSYPYAQRIRVDALWGYPDGLLYYPHDTYFYYPETNKKKKIINFKSVCLFPTIGGWKPYEIEEPYDWQSVLSESEVQTLSLWALRLANSLGKEVQLMAFAKLGENQGNMGCLPWHFTNLPIYQYSDSLKILPNLTRISVVKTWEDFFKLENNQGELNSTGILIMPTTEILRSNEFITKTATFAASHRVPLYFLGSLLSHAYYLMSKTGAKVIPIAQDEPKDNSISYNKLVRDKIPIIIKQAGGLAQIRKLDKTKAIVLLSQKVIEEAFEVWNSKNDQELLNELADVLEVVEALIKAIGIKKDDLEDIKKSKIAKRGGFEELFFLEETAIRSLKSVNNKNGALPLFLDDNNLHLAKRDNSKNLLKFLSEADNEKVIHFSVPLIPQIDNNLNIKTLDDGIGKFKIKINYEDNRLNIKISINDTKLLSHFGETDGIQLSLF